MIGVDFKEGLKKLITIVTGITFVSWSVAIGVLIYHVWSVAIGVLIYHVCRLVN